MVLRFYIEQFFFTKISADMRNGWFTRYLKSDKIFCRPVSSILIILVIDFRPTIIIFSRLQVLQNCQASRYKFINTSNVSFMDANGCVKFCCTKSFKHLKWGKLYIYIYVCDIKKPPKVGL